MTAFYTIFNQLALPVPSSFPPTTPPPHATAPILIYGAGSTAGQYAVQLLHIAGYQKILVTASSKHHEFLHSLGATYTFDYNSPNLIGDIAKIVGGDGKVAFAVDCIAAEPTIATIAEIISPTGVVAILLPTKKGKTLTVDDGSKMSMELPADNSPFSQAVKTIGVRTFLYLEVCSTCVFVTVYLYKLPKDEFLKINLMPKILPSLLKAGVITPNRVRLLDQGTFKERVEVGLDLLRNNKISGEKVVVKIPQ